MKQLTILFCIIIFLTNITIGQNKKAVQSDGQTAFGSEGKQMEDDVKHLAEILQKSGKKNLHIDFAPLPDENHLTILHNSVYKGLRYYTQKKLFKKINHEDQENLSVLLLVSVIDTVCKQAVALTLKVPAG